MGQPPLKWAQDAVWYQIFPERFYNGDKSNDPTAESLVGVWPWEDQEEWEITPWTSDWYQLQPWEKANGKQFNYQFQLRRYGGDIQGIIDKLDYFESLGVNALYLNPVFESPSSHKYGTAAYHHIDKHFGPDPAEDARRIKNEDPADPETWVWTTADSLFLTLVEEVHKRNMRIIIDGVFNHVGLSFWAFQDVVEKREESPYFPWFVIEGSDLPDKSHLNEFNPLPAYFLKEGQDSLSYAGYVTDLPSFRQDSLGPVQPIREHFKAVVSRWMDPNGDGNPADGIDGWRLDVAERLQIKFWDLFGSWVREINPDAYITGEVWWEDYWNNKQFNAEPWLKEGRFNGVMNYRFADAMFKYFIDEKDRITTTELDRLLAGVRNEYPANSIGMLQNLLDSHDSERITSAVVNPDRWLDHGNNLWWNRDFDIRRPNAKEINKLKLILSFQFAYIGAPYIYYGDEVGMWGADDPDCRKPMVWDEFNYDDETAHPCDYFDDCNYSRPVNEVKVDTNLLQYYKQLISLRKEHPALRRGNFNTIFQDDDAQVYVFTRTHENETVMAVFNNGKGLVKIADIFQKTDRNTWENIMTSSAGNGNTFIKPGSSQWFVSE